MDGDLFLFVIRLPQVGGMDVTGTPASKIGLEGHDGENGDHCDKASHWRVYPTEEVGEAGIRQGHEGHRKKVYEGGGQEHTSAEMLAVEEELSSESGFIGLIRHER